MTKEYTLVLLKPEAIKWGIAGDAVTDLLKTKLKLIGSKLVKVSEDLAKKHYIAHKEKPFFETIVKHLSGHFHQENVLAFVYIGENAISIVRDVVGHTDPTKAAPNTIRGKHGKINKETGVFENIIHASATLSEAETEIKLWFKPEELTEKLFKTKKVNMCIDKELWK
jgi:nucleoside-diphosphate kinase